MSSLCGNDPALSVVIATKNRDQALQKISLPSLLCQDEGNFEVLVWDASDSSRSREVVCGFEGSFADRGIPLRFVSAPRSGLVSQRNDALKEAGGEIVFFIDDDSEVSPDGLRSLRECFAAYPEIMGGGLRVEDLSCRPKSDRRHTLRDSLYRLFRYRRRRKVSFAGSAKGLSAPSGAAEWLSGCSMAFRRAVFDDLSFNEKLEAFGPYALAEDVEFSHRVFLFYGKPLMVPEKGCVIHHAVAGERVAGTEKKAAMVFYNRYLLMLAASRNHPFAGHFLFLWTVLRIWVKLSRSFGFSVAYRGLQMALKQVLKDTPSA